MARLRKGQSWPPGSPVRIADSIEVFYNRRHLHSTLGYHQTPGAGDVGGNDVATTSWRCRIRAGVQGAPPRARRQLTVKASTATTTAGEE